jgi:hypothetical protein
MRVRRGREGGREVSLKLVVENPSDLTILCYIYERKIYPVTTCPSQFSDLALQDYVLYLTLQPEVKSSRLMLQWSTYTFLESPTTHPIQLSGSLALSFT